MVSPIRLSAVLLGAVLLLATIGEASAAPKRVTGSDLAALLYGRDHMVYMPSGADVSVHYDAKGVQYSGSKRTGDIMRAGDNSWCNYTGKKLNACMSIWKDTKGYIARFGNGTIAFIFTVS